MELVTFVRRLMVCGSVVQVVGVELFQTPPVLAVWSAARTWIWILQMLALSIPPR